MTGDCTATYAMPLKLCCCGMHGPCCSSIKQVVKMYHNKLLYKCLVCVYAKPAAHDIPGCGDHGGQQLAVQVALHCFLYTERLCPMRASTPTKESMLHYFSPSWGGLAAHATVTWRSPMSPASF